MARKNSTPEAEQVDYSTLSKTAGRKLGIAERKAVRDAEAAGTEAPATPYSDWLAQVTEAEAQARPETAPPREGAQKAGTGYFHEDTNTAGQPRVAVDNRKSVIQGYLDQGLVGTMVIVRAMRKDGIPVGRWITDVLAEIAADAEAAEAAKESKPKRQRKPRTPKQDASTEVAA